MTFTDWIRHSVSEVRSYGLSGAKRSVLGLYVGYLRRLNPEPIGKNVYDRDWDVLVILDALRYDLANEVAEEYDLLCSTTVPSIGRTSMQWMERTFTEAYADEMERTAYVSGNPHTANHVDPSRFRLLDEVWRYAWDDDIGTTPADAVTDRAVAVGREYTPERLIVHYMQPHYPFVPAPLTKGIDTNWVYSPDDDPDELRELLKRGAVSRKEVWARYRDNLHYVLENVETLLNNVDAETVVITADHGTAYGELGLFGHNEDNPLDVVNTVPWCVTSASDTETYSPRLERKKEAVDVTDRLRSLGYVE